MYFFLYMGVSLVRYIHMHKSRNLTSHTYDEETANEIVEGIRNEYFRLLMDLLTRLEQEKAGKQTTLFDE